MMQDELSSLFGRPVDLVEREGLRNPFRRDRILSTVDSGWHHMGEDGAGDGNRTRVSSLEG